MCITPDIEKLSIVDRFAQSYMTQNHQKFGKLCQMIWKTFQHSQPSKTPLNSECHMLAHVIFVKSTSIRLVSYNLWIQNQLFLFGFLFYLKIYNFYPSVLVARTLFFSILIFFILLLITIVDVDWPFYLGVLYCIFFIRNNL